MKYITCLTCGFRGTVEGDQCPNCHQWKLVEPGEPEIWKRKDLKRMEEEDEDI